jgi:hypothetical protein
MRRTTGGVRSVWVRSQRLEEVECWIEIGGWDWERLRGVLEMDVWNWRVRGVRGGFRRGVDCLLLPPDKYCVVSV